MPIRCCPGINSPPVSGRLTPIVIVLTAGDVPPPKEQPERAMTAAAHTTAESFGEDGTG